MTVRSIAPHQFVSVPWTTKRCLLQDKFHLNGNTNLIIVVEMGEYTCLSKQIYMLYPWCKINVNKLEESIYFLNKIKTPGQNKFAVSKSFFITIEIVFVVCVE